MFNVVKNQRRGRIQLKYGTFSRHRITKEKKNGRKQSNSRCLKDYGIYKDRKIELQMDNILILFWIQN